MEHVADIKDLAACRLVCKSWAPFAERAMFQKECRFTQPAAQRKYYKHLIKKPALAQHIRFIHIVAGTDISFYINFIKAAFTPNVKTIEGCLRNDDEDYNNGIYNLVYCTARYEEGDYTLEYLLFPNSWKNSQLVTFLFFAKTLKRLDMDFHAALNEEDARIKSALLDQRHKFESLTTFKPTIAGLAPEEFEQLLRKCSPIEKLDLDLLDARMTEVVDFDEWMMSRVEKDTSVRRLDMNGAASPRIVSYFKYKYPNLIEADIASLEALIASSL